MASPYRDDLMAAMAHAEDAEREISRLESELELVREERDRLGVAAAAVPDAVVPSRPAFDQRDKEIARLSRACERMRRKHERWRRRRPKGPAFNVALMVVAGVIGAWIASLLHHWR